MIVALNKLIVFLLEIVMIISFSCFGFQRGPNLYMKWMLATVLPVISALLWGYFAAPKSSYRLPMPYLAIFRALIFLAASYCLYKCNKTNMAIYVAILSIVTQFLSYYYGN